VLPEGFVVFLAADDSDYRPGSSPFRAQVFSDWPTGKESRILERSMSNTAILVLSIRVLDVRSLFISNEECGRVE
jgi:hypothetical protein